MQSSETELSGDWAEHYGTAAPRLVRETIRLDGFASANAGYDGGELTTRPLALGGKRLLLNYATSAVGSVRVEVQDVATGAAIPGLSMQECDEIYGDELRRPSRGGAGMTCPH